MSRSHNTNRQHRRKGWVTGKGVGEHTKRNQRRKKAKNARKHRQYQVDSEMAMRMEAVTMEALD